VERKKTKNKRGNEDSPQSKKATKRCNVMWQYQRTPLQEQSKATGEPRLRNAPQGHSVRAAKRLRLAVQSRCITKFQPFFIQV
jgi:hypothetical protein